MLIRAVGPSLTQFGVTGALTAPRLELFRGQTSLAVNAGIAGNRAVIDAAGVQAGAFPLAPRAPMPRSSPRSRRAPTPRSSAARAASPGSPLVEVYDLSGASPGQKLLNISTRAAVGTGETS